jgi:hypothetical protein
VFGLERDSSCRGEHGRLLEFGGVCLSGRQPEHPLYSCDTPAKFQTRRGKYVGPTFPHLGHSGDDARPSGRRADQGGSRAVSGPALVWRKSPYFSPGLRGSAAVWRGSPGVRERNSTSSAHCSSVSFARRRCRSMAASIVARGSAPGSTRVWQLPHFRRWRVAISARVASPSSEAEIPGSAGPGAAPGEATEVQLVAASAKTQATAPRQHQIGPFEPKDEESRSRMDTSYHVDDSALDSHYQER